MANIDRYGIREVCDLRFYDIDEILAVQTLTVDPNTGELKNV